MSSTYEKSAVVTSLEMLNKSKRMLNHRPRLLSAKSALLITLTACLTLACFTTPARAGITYSGNVNPANPATWTDLTKAYVGNTGNGSITVDGGSDIRSDRSYIGNSSGSLGTVTIDGYGSTWTNDYRIWVGYYGNGILNIKNGGAVNGNYSSIGLFPGSMGEVTVDGTNSKWANNGQLEIGWGGSGTLNITNGGAVTSQDGMIGSSASGTGKVSVKGADSIWTLDRSLSLGNSGEGTLEISDGGLVEVKDFTQVDHHNDGGCEIHFNNGTLTTTSLFAGASHLTGIGTINTHGLVSDVDLVFDTMDDLTQTLTLNEQPGQNITINANFDGQGVLGVGYNGYGSLAIRNGVTVLSKDGHIGFRPGSMGAASVDGIGSAWICRTIIVGNGTLNITNGGVVNSQSGGVGLGCDSLSEATVDGVESMWTNSSDLCVGGVNGGTLRITNGAVVSSDIIVIGDTMETNGEGKAIVDGIGSTLIGTNLMVGGELSGSSGTLNVSGGGLVSVGGLLTIDPCEPWNSFINMSTGGMLALKGDDVSGSIGEFLGLVEGTDAIRYWDDSIGDWADITGATPGEDYTLTYITEGDLAGYTMLTVGVPEPATLCLMGFGVAAVIRRRWRA